MFFIRKGLILGLSALLVSPAILAGGTHGGGHHGNSGTAGGASANNNHMHGGGHAHAQGGDVASAVGTQGDPKRVTRTINVELLDSMRFVFSPKMQLKRGDVVRFVVRNAGAIRHEFSIGNAAEQEAHRAMMRQMPDMVHEDANSVTVEPGQTRELVWAFTGESQVELACNIPGHSEAGMTASVSLGS
jgi:uncharacterized cupredoxin-like copper-binding protein